jgi:hypothetical protein
MSGYHLAPKSLLRPPSLKVMSQKLSCQSAEKLAYKRIGITQVSKTKQRNIVRLTRTLSFVAKLVPTKLAKGSAILINARFVRNIRKLLTKA